MNTDHKAPRKKKPPILSCNTTDRIKFSVDFIARVKRRTISNLIEFALLEVVERTEYKEKPAQDMIDKLWVIDEHERFLNYVFFAPKLLTYEEETLWKSIRLTSYFWKEGNNEPEQTQYIDNLIVERVGEYWGTLWDVVKSKVPASQLPEYVLTTDERVRIEEQRQMKFNARAGRLKKKGTKNGS